MEPNTHYLNKRSRITVKENINDYLEVPQYTFILQYKLYSYRKKHWFSLKKEKIYFWENVSCVSLGTESLRKAKKGYIIHSLKGSAKALRKIRRERINFERKSIQDFL